MLLRTECLQSLSEAGDKLPVIKLVIFLFTTISRLLDTSHSFHWLNFASTIMRKTWI